MASTTEHIISIVFFSDSVNSDSASQLPIWIRAIMFFTFRANTFWLQIKRPRFFIFCFFLPNIFLQFHLDQLRLHLLSLFDEGLYIRLQTWIQIKKLLVFFYKFFINLWSVWRNPALGYACSARRETHLNFTSKFYKLGNEVIIRVR